MQIVLKIISALANFEILLSLKYSLTLFLNVLMKSALASRENFTCLKSIVKCFTNKIDTVRSVDLVIVKGTHSFSKGLEMGCDNFVKLDYLELNSIFFKFAL